MDMSEILLVLVEGFKHCSEVQGKILAVKLLKPLLVCLHDRIQVGMDNGFLRIEMTIIGGAVHSGLCGDLPNGDIGIGFVLHEQQKCLLDISHHHL